MLFSGIILKLNKGTGIRTIYVFCLNILCYRLAKSLGAEL